MMAVDFDGPPPPKCPTADSDTMTSSITIPGVDLALLRAQKDSFESCFTSQLQLSSPSNIKASVEVHKIQQLDSGDCKISYRCSGVGDQPSAETCLGTIPNSDAFQTILAKCYRVQS
ncbi:unnamed protein product [Adineta steineri]|uniref:Uncharacterized protein n=1 Tax=Adineta steineri TaxID=433720 RepID=A0A814CHH8_9BILA|nr:unnamed protein product [Adineta steineri]CAF4228303.1 unnamed protein product [Adineta steineri]